MCKYAFLLFLNFFVLLTFVKGQQQPKFSSSVLGQCQPSEFRCSNGSCIESRSRCDQKLDCLDGSDEAGCDQRFNNGLVISDKTTTVNSTINNIQNLMNLNPSNCTQDEFPCQAGGCVLSSARCNSTSECPDGSDETNCTSQVLSSTACPSALSTKKIRNRKILTKNSNETKGVVEETQHLLEEGDREIELRQDYRDIVLVAGLTGAGKTTITKFITNPNDLEAYENGGRILIRDIVNNSISSISTVVSKTIFPQLLIHGPSNTAFYDLPGFSDTRTATIEIANAFFMKKVAEHAERVKILLVVSHKGLRNGGSRTDIKTLIEHLTRFVKDIEKFSQGVVLVASKVEDNRNSNKKIINFIGQFLEGVEKDLPQIFPDLEKLRHAQIFLATLLEKDETGKYKRIGMFKQPQVAGPLMDNPNFESNQNQVQDLVLRKAQFVSTSPGDFGFSVSADATLIGKTLATETKNKVGLLIEELTEVIEEELFEYPEDCSPGTSRWMSLKKWTLQHSIFHQMTNVLNDEVGNCSQFFHVLNNTLSVFSNPEIDEFTLDLFKLDKQLSFFDQITLEYDTPPPQWVNSFGNLENKIGEKAKQLAEELNNHVLNITSAISKSLKQQTLDLISTTAATTNATVTRESENGTETNYTTIAGSNVETPPQQDKNTLLQHLTEDFASINRMQSQLLTTSTFAQYSNITLNGLGNTHFKVPSSISTSLEDIDFDMNFNSGINGQRFPFKLDSWVKDIELFSGFLQTQIQALSFHFSEETRRQNEEKMREQLETLRNETRQAAEKAEEESKRLALEYEKREEELNGSLSTLTNSLAKLRQEQKQEREEVKKQLEEREKIFNGTLIKLREEREKEKEALGKQLEERENAFNGSLTKLTQDFENEKMKLETELEERAKSFNGSLADVKEQQEKERNATRIKLEQQEGAYNKSIIKLEEDRKKEQEDAKKQQAEREKLYDQNLANLRQDQQKEINAMGARFNQIAQDRKKDKLAGIRRTKTFPEHQNFDLSISSSIFKPLNDGQHEVGSWGPVEYCPQDSIVTGFKLGFVPYRGSPGSAGQVWGAVFTLGITSAIYAGENAFDDYGLVGIGLYCSNVFNNEETKNIKSDYFTNKDIADLNNVAVTSTWLGSFSNSSFNCPQRHPAIGFKIKNQPAQGSHDDFGAINFKLICSGPSATLPDPPIVYDVVTDAKWTEDIMCPDFHAICGIMTQVHRVHYKTDSSGLTDAFLYCCKMKDL